MRFLSRINTCPYLPLGSLIVICSVTLLYAAKQRSFQESREHYPKYRGETMALPDNLSGDIAADRALHVGDLDLVLELSDFLVDKRNSPSVRDNAAEGLGAIGHRYGIPALVAVLRDEDDDARLRQEVVNALSMIRDKRVVSILIKDALGSPHPRLRLQAWEDLPQFVGGPDEFYSTSYRTLYKPPPEAEKEREAYIEVWLDWWEKHSDKATLSRGPRGGF